MQVIQELEEELEKGLYQHTLPVWIIAAYAHQKKTDGQYLFIKGMDHTVVSMTITAMVKLGIKSFAYEISGTHWAKWMLMDMQRMGCRIDKMIYVLDTLMNDEGRYPTVPALLIHLPETQVNEIGELVFTPEIIEARKKSHINWLAQKMDTERLYQNTYESQLKRMSKRSAALSAGATEILFEAGRERRNKVNKVILMGRLTKEPDIRYSQGENQTAIARYTLAVDRRGRKDQSADFIPCIAFGCAAEFAEKYFHQGTKILVTGRIQTGSYTNRDGHKVYTTDVIIEEQEFAESKSTAEGSASRQNSRQRPATESAEGFMDIPDGVEDEGVPFS